MLSFIRKVLEVIGACVLMICLFVMCYTPNHATRITVNEAAKAGFDKAYQCFPTSTHLNDIQLNVVTGKEFQVLLSSTPVVGFSMYHRVYIAEQWVNDTATWAHEFIHSFGVIGHPKNIFERCQL